MSENMHSLPHDMNAASEQEALFPLSELGPENNRVEYRLLTGHYRTDGSFKSTEQLQSQYMELTDKLVSQMTNGLPVHNPETGELEVRKPDVVVWLDKSARPVSWLAKAAWPQLAAEADGTVPEMPKFTYANIDREQWINQVDPGGTGMMNINNIDQSIIRSLRSVFVGPAQKADKLGEHIDTATSQLDGKTIMIVDEVNATGRTLDIAQKFFARAFPDAYIGGTHWMGGVAMKKGAVGNADLPVWYRDDIEHGRGVGNRNETKSQGSPSMTQRLGGFFLSTSLGKDPLADQLRSELIQLAKDAADHKVHFRPSMDRPDFDERLERYNDMTIDEFVAWKKRQQKQKR